MTDITEEKSLSTQQGAEITDDDRKRFKQAVGTVSLFHPMWGHRRVKENLEASGVSIGYNTVNELLQEIKQERLERFNEDSKEEAHAQYEDMMYWVIERCREVMAEEIKVRDKNGTVKQQFYAQQNRLQAIKLAKEAMESLMDFKMDLGIFERQLGTVKNQQTLAELGAMWREVTNNPTKYESGAIRELEANTSQ